MSGCTAELKLIRNPVCADSFFDNVCELDLVFNFYKVCYNAATLLLSASNMME